MRAITPAAITAAAADPRVMKPMVRMSSLGCRSDSLVGQRGERRDQGLERHRGQWTLTVTTDGTTVESPASLSPISG